MRHVEGVLLRRTHIEHRLLPSHHEEMALTTQVFDTHEGYTYEDTYFGASRVWAKACCGESVLAVRGLQELELLREALKRGALR